MAQAITDPLTGAFNRRYLHAQIDRLAGEGPLIRMQIERAEWLPGRGVTVSIGVSAHAGAQAVRQWIKAADAALYEAKRGGRNRVVEAAATA